MSQLGLLFGRTLRLPPDDDGSHDLDRVDFVPVTVDLSPAQSRWMGVHEPANPGCVGCCLFGCCALHDDDKKHEGRRLQPTALTDATPSETKE